MYQYFLASLIVLAISLSSFTQAATYGGGSGTPADPYQISDVNDLLSLASDTINYDKCYILTADIDFKGQIFTNAIIAADMINDPERQFDGTDFSGVFNGNGHKIMNFIIRGASQCYLGLFGRISWGGPIENLYLENCTIEASSGSCYSGEIAGYVFVGTINNCHSSGVVSGDEAVGGLVGHSEMSTLNNCYSTTDVAGKTNIGGLVGYNSRGITNCYSRGDVSGDNCIGGLVGLSVSGEIQDSCSQGNVTGNYNTGGLVGKNLMNDIRNSYSASDISGKERVGGLAGSSSGHIVNCYSTGDVSGDDYIGGLVGDNSFGMIEKSCSVSKITDKDFLNYSGGLVGYDEDNMVTNSFWDMQTCGMTTSAGGAGAQGQTTSEMKTLSTYINAGWDFAYETANGIDDVWRMCSDGINYPRLTWESTLGDIVCPDGVGAEDLTVMVEYWLKTWQVKADFIDDSVINIADFSVLGESWLYQPCYPDPCPGTGGTGIIADITEDGSVDILDMTAFADLWMFQEDPNCKQADINNDGTVNLEDLSILAENWMKP